jgi:hypothetical protein
MKHGQSVNAWPAMPVYITDAQIPELAGFPPAARRLLRYSAFQQMFAERPWLRWVPKGLCAVGVVLGVLTFGSLPQSLYIPADEGIRMFIPAAYIPSLGMVAGFIGAQYITHRARRYLRRLI